MQDSVLLTSDSLCERVQLWDKYAGPVDEETVKLEFFRKIHRKNPPFRIKRKVPQLPRVSNLLTETELNTLFQLLQIVVPDMVKYHYKKPVQLLPSLKDVLRIETVYRKKRLKEQLDNSEGNIDLDCQQSETETTQSDEIQTCDISDIGCVWQIYLSTI